jgi:hypothetical protein
VTSRERWRIALAAPSGKLATPAIGVFPAARELAVVSRYF